MNQGMLSTQNGYYYKDLLRRCCRLLFVRTYTQTSVKSYMPLLYLLHPFKPLFFQLMFLVKLYMVSLLTFD